jgi:hypothetical protein
MEYKEYRNEKGELHRVGGLPACEWANNKFWYVNGKFHRENGLPAEERANGDKAWLVNGKFHREPLPGSEGVGRLPAIEWASGYKAWWVNGVNITAFREKYLEVHRIRAQKRIYFWIIPRLYRPGSDSAKRLAEASWQKTLKDGGVLKMIC